ncbi:cystathionine beta-lyase [Mesobacillus campisalis]|uniref:cysteine-S-conjugate beta-lyase n=1 Tax=Mesobacillus campisalis TaxID=1408103 RepID=A0A0M2SYQ2_9BACI|nr:MalY/PatB family protein [Mesobacillus campisalis]KKK39308.1 cystathionine beta-lyase [Mesobacillus campisalis]
MGSYDFNQNIDRKSTASVKWEMVKQVFGEEDVLPMWVADMDFLPPREVVEAIKNRVDHGIYGYTFVRQEAGEAVAGWQKKRHGWDIDPSWIVYSPGVVPTIALAIQAYTEPGDKVMLQSPVYTPFFDMAKVNGRTVVNSQLKLIGDTYEIDFEDFEQQLKDGVKLFLLCNPHNPGGRVWREEELIKIGDLCLQYGCLILADEIHSDLVFKPNKHIPIASIKEEYKKIVLTGIAPSKTFNIAGLQSSAVVIPDKELRRKFTEQQKMQGFFSLNVFGITAMEAAYLHGEPWLEELLVYLKENTGEAVSFIKAELPDIKPVVPEATYLLWLDCRQTGWSDEEIKERLLKKGKLGLNLGTGYGPGGEGFVRMNLACPREILREGLNRLKISFT